MTLPDPGAPPARLVETHISVLIFVGERVYKLRKPVRYDFLDFTDRAVRQADCRREVELNRRLAPDVYLGVADIVMNGEPLDHMVVMRALPEDRRLATLVQGPSDVEPLVGAVADALAGFHAGARRAPAISATASAHALRLEWGANFKETARFVGPVLDPAVDREIGAQVTDWLARHAALLDERVAHGWVCDGHGDLQAEDIFCLDDGVRILDCIEFSDELRYGDVCADVAFLAMDLERLGRPDAAADFVSAYERACREPLPAPLLHYYVAERAYVRAKVACLRHEQGVAGADAAARALHLLALRHLRLARLVVVLVGGPPGTGKSTLARQLAAETGWTLLRSDEIRQELAGRLGRDRYAPAAVRAVYDELLGRARRLAGAGRSVVLDATWAGEGGRAVAAGVAADSGAELVALRCTCAEDVAAARVARRLGQGEDASEATEAVRRAVAAHMDPWPSAVVLDTTSDPPAEVAATALQVLAGLAPPGRPAHAAP